MRAYEHFLGVIGGFLKAVVIGAIIIGVAGGLIYGVYTATSADEETRKINHEARAWCLDNGGRTVKIDGIWGCFQLSEVEIEVGFWNSKQTACQRNPNLVWMKAPGARGNERYCYSYKRISEN